MEYKQLIEERAKVVQEINGLSALVARENRSFSAEELEKFDKMDNDFKALGEKIDTLKRIERANEIKQPSEYRAENKAVTSYKGKETITREDQELAFKHWALCQIGHGHKASAAHQNAARKVGMNPNTDTLTLTLGDNEIQRNQSSSVNSEGGYLQNDGIFQGLERNMKWFGGVRQFAKVVRTDTGEPLPYAYSDDTANFGVRLGQNVAVSNVAVTYSKKTIGEFTYTSGVFPVAVQLLQDARLDVSADIGEVLGQRLGRVTNTDYTNGSGASAPFGYMSEATAGATAGSATVFAYADFVKLLMSVDRAYRDDPSFAFVMNDTSLSLLMRTVDGSQRPIFWNQNMNLASGFDMTVLNKRVIINNDMPAPTTGLKPVAAIVGSKFIVRDVREATIVALKERYMDQLAVGFMAYLRTDCKLLNTNCCKLLTML